jgi:hypothetical protein
MLWYNVCSRMNCRPDFWVSGCYGGQLDWATANNQICLAHLIPDMQHVIDAGDDNFAPELRHLLGRACRIGRRRERLADSAQFFQNSRLANVVGEMTFQFVAKICFRCIRAMTRRARPALKQKI